MKSRFSRVAAGILFVLLIVAGGLPARAEPNVAPPFENLGRAFEPVATVLDWAGHLLLMGAGAYREARFLPDGHVLEAAEAERQFLTAGEAELALTWFGHAAFLIRMNGKAILTDPLLYDDVGASPFRIRRLVPVLPERHLIDRLDAVIISHADFDHFDMRSLRWLAERFPAASLHVPAGTARLARATGFRTIVEMPWYTRFDVGNVGVIAVPAIHGVRRPPFGIDSMHWSGYVLEGGGRRVYFAGDTAWGPIYEDIRRRIGRVDYALVPNGAWAPRDFQAPYHVDPEEAAEIARVLGARLAIGMHWGTLALSPESPLDQKARFLAAGTPQMPTTVMRIGETRVLVP